MYIYYTYTFTCKYFIYLHMATARPLEPFAGSSRIFDQIYQFSISPLRDLRLLSHPVGPVI